MESEINAQFKSSLAEQKPFGGINCGGGAVALSTSKGLGWVALGLCQLWQQLGEPGPGLQEGCGALADPQCLLQTDAVWWCGKTPVLPVAQVTLRLWLNTGEDKALKYSRTVLFVNKSIWIIHLARFTRLFYSLHCDTSFLNLFSQKNKCSLRVSPKNEIYVLH